MQAAKAGWAAKTGRDATLNLGHLVECGLLQPGPGVLSYKHSQNEFLATLTPEGTIFFNGEGSCAQR